MAKCGVGLWVWAITLILAIGQTEATAQDDDWRKLVDSASVVSRKS
jgi:hypothetical protein